MKTRILFIVLTITLLLVGLVGCGIPEETDKLVLYTSDNGCSSLLNPAVEIFRNLYPDVEVAYEVVDPDTYQTMIREEVPAGQGPDLVLLQNKTLPDLYKTMSSGVFEDLNRYFDKDEEIDLADFVGPVMEAGVLKGKRTLVPLTYEVSLLLTTESILDEIGMTADELETCDGERIGYSKLLVATGAHPIAPGFPYLEGYRPLVLRTMEDAERLKTALVRESCHEVLVAGTSMVGLKVLEACLDQSVQVTMLGRSPRILRASAHADIAARFERMLEQRGITLRLGQTAEQTSYDEATRTCEVAFSTGERSSFDEIVLAQGVQPNLDFLGPNDAEHLQGLVVDPFMRTTMPDVFAAGDCARVTDLSTGEMRSAGLWQCAVQQGRCAGRAMAAELAGRVPTLPYTGFIPANVIHVRDMLFASAGSLREGADRRIEFRDEGAVFSAFAWAELAGEERLVGFNVVAEGAQTCDCEELNGRIGRYRAEIRKTFLDMGGSI